MRVRYLKKVYGPYCELSHQERDLNQFESSLIQLMSATIQSKSSPIQSKSSPIQSLTKVKSLRQACRKFAAHYFVRQRNLETVCRSVRLVAHFWRTRDCAPQRARLCARTRIVCEKCATIYSYSKQAKLCARSAPEDFLCIFILSRYQERATKCARIA